MLETLLSDFSEPVGTVGMMAAFIRLLIATILGGAIGWEREMQNRPAGLRTHMLVSLAACLFTLIAFEMVGISYQDGEKVHFDPLRVIEAVTAGVAFLAAGSIITSGGKVKGLTTGAGMWMAGAIGMTCGIGHLPLAIAATIVAIVVLWVLRILDAPTAAKEPENKDS